MIITISFECNGKLHAVAMMKMVFLNYQFKTITGKEALSVRNCLLCECVEGLIGRKYE